MNLEEYRNALRSQLNDLNDEGSELNIWLAGVLKDKDDIARREIFMENMSQLLIKQQTLSQVLDDLKKENGPDWLASEVLNHSGSYKKMTKSRQALELLMETSVPPPRNWYRIKPRNWYRIK